MGKTDSVTVFFKNRAIERVTSTGVMRILREEQQIMLRQLGKVEVRAKLQTKGKDQADKGTGGHLSGRRNRLWDCTEVCE